MLRVVCVGVVVTAVSFVPASVLRERRRSRRPRPPPQPPPAASSPDGSDAGAGRPPRSRELQGDHQGTHAVRRSPAGHRSQPRGGRLDRGAAQELRLSDRAHQVRVRHAAAGQHGRRARRARRRRARRDSAGNKRPGQGGSTIFGTAGRTGVNTDPTAQPDEKLRALNSQPATDGPREEVYCTKVGIEDARRDVHHRRPHGRPRLGRSGQRRRLGHGARDGAGAHLQQPRRADRSHHPLRAVEQRGDRPERRARLRRRSARRCRARRIRPGQGSIPSRSGWA